MEKKILKFSLLSLFFIFYSSSSFSEEKIQTDIFGSPPLISNVKISPSGEKIAVFMPTTFPSISNNGPPEFPLLIDASV